MTRPSNLGASAQAKLRNLAQARGDDVQVLLTQFVLERLPVSLANRDQPDRRTSSTPLLDTRRALVVTAP